MSRSIEPNALVLDSTMHLLVAPQQAQVKGASENVVMYYPLVDESTIAWDARHIRWDIESARLPCRFS